MATHPAIPRHIAIIMDGNGRWAKERGFPRLEGHRAGAESVREVMEACIELGVEYLTLYAFSSENWSRPATEVTALMSLLDRFLDEKAKDLDRQNVRLLAIGQLDRLPEKTRALVERITTRTAGRFGGRGLWLSRRGNGLAGSSKRSPRSPGGSSFPRKTHRA